MSDEQSPTNQDGVSRREFIHGVLVVSTVAIAAGSVLTSASASALTPVSLPIGDRQLAAVLDRLVPANSAMPGAGELGLGRFIEDVLTVAPHLRTHLDELQAVLPGADECECRSQEDAEQLLGDIERRHPDAFQTLIRLTYSGYYSHPLVLARLGLKSTDFDYRLERFDERSLADVQRMEARTV